MTSTRTPTARGHCGATGGYCKLALIHWKGKTSSYEKGRSRIYHVHIIIRRRRRREPVVAQRVATARVCVFVERRTCSPRTLTLHRSSNRRRREPVRRARPRRQRLPVDIGLRRRTLAARCDPRRLALAPDRLGLVSSRRARAVAGGGTLRRRRTAVPARTARRGVGPPPRRVTRLPPRRVPRRPTLVLDGVPGTCHSRTTFTRRTRSCC